MFLAGNSLTPGYDRSNSRMPSAVLKPLNQENLDMLEYPFLNLLTYPPGFIVHLGATVSARSVKLLEKATEKDEVETRDGWFNELRMVRILIISQNFQFSSFFAIRKFADTQNHSAAMSSSVTQSLRQSAMT